MLVDSGCADLHYPQRIPVSDIIQAFIQQQPRRIYQRSVLEDKSLLSVNYGLKIDHLIIINKDLLIDHTLMNN